MIIPSISQLSKHLKSNQCVLPQARASTKSLSSRLPVACVVVACGSSSSSSRQAARVSTYVFQMGDLSPRILRARAAWRPRRRLHSSPCALFLGSCVTCMTRSTAVMVGSVCPERRRWRSSSIAWKSVLSYSGAVVDIERRRKRSEERLKEEEGLLKRTKSAKRKRDQNESNRQATDKQRENQREG